MLTSSSHSTILLHTNWSCEFFLSSGGTGRDREIKGERYWRRVWRAVVQRVSWLVLLCMPSLWLQACAAVFLLHCRALCRLLLTTLDWFPWQPGSLHMESNQLPSMRAFVSTVTITKKERERRRESHSYPYITYISGWVINYCLSNQVVKPSKVLGVQCFSVT